VGWEEDAARVDQRTACVGPLCVVEIFGLVFFERLLPAGAGNLGSRFWYGGWLRV
jgi:hypothetical protein